MYKIRTYNAISVKGLDRFPRAQFEVGSDVAHPDAFLLRSQKLHDESVPDTLLAAARAGAGVNNIPVVEYGKKGIVVFNTPGANANAVKELVLAGMLLAARGVLPGIAYAQSLHGMTDAGEMSKLLEKEKSRFAGNELRGKTLGIVGLGAIGSSNAAFARRFMETEGITVAHSDLGGSSARKIEFLPYEGRSRCTKVAERVQERPPAPIVPPAAHCGDLELF